MLVRPPLATPLGPLLGVYQSGRRHSRLASTLARCARRWRRDDRRRSRPRRARDATLAATTCGSLRPTPDGYGDSRHRHTRDPAPRRACNAYCHDQRSRTLAPTSLRRPPPRQPLRPPKRTRTPRRTPPARPGQCSRTLAPIGAHRLAALDSTTTTGEVVETSRGKRNSARSAIAETSLGGRARFYQRRGRLKRAGGARYSQEARSQKRARASAILIIFVIMR